MQEEIWSKSYSIRSMDGSQLFRSFYTAEKFMGTLPIARNEETQDWHDDRMYQIKLDQDEDVHVVPMWYQWRQTFDSA